MTLSKFLIMVNFMRQLNRLVVAQNASKMLFLHVSVRLCLKEISIFLRFIHF